MENTIYKYTIMFTGSGKPMLCVIDNKLQLLPLPTEGSQQDYVWEISVSPEGDTCLYNRKNNVSIIDLYRVATLVPGMTYGIRSHAIDIVKNLWVYNAAGSSIDYHMTVDPRGNMIFTDDVPERDCIWLQSVVR
ncbi:hypothetical protein [Enterobacter asburiae]|uniref:hypothetical protein n=1 Tax=Enterobacter asburiae TaxID=61645 RepID=UPI003F573F90